MARPSIATDELVQEICDLIAEGESLRRICEREDMPDRRTVLRWVDTVEGFATKYERAREAQGDVMDEKILETAEACTAADFQVARVKIGAYQWRAEKLKPKRYGPATLVKHADANGEKLPMSETDAAARIAALIATAQARAAGAGEPEPESAE